MNIWVKLGNEWVLGGWKEADGMGWERKGKTRMGRKEERGKRVRYRWDGMGEEQRHSEGRDHEMGR